jgi:hypothetical protein
VDKLLVVLLLSPYIMWGASTFAYDASGYGTERRNATGSTAGSL